uniref:Uncharacterized protein n=1 Tax=Arundo donax TaxID=35708 RepID=A0A0A9CVP2_ARUDO
MHNPTLDPRTVVAVRVMHRHLVSESIRYVSFLLVCFLWVFFRYHRMKPRNNLRTPSDTVLLPCTVNEKAILSDDTTRPFSFSFSPCIGPFVWLYGFVICKQESTQGLALVRYLLYIRYYMICTMRY